MAFRSSARTSRAVDEDNPYWISFSDIMSGLLVIFILASLQLILELSEKNEMIDDAIKELAERNQARAEMLEEISAELSSQGIDVEIAENKSVLRIPDDQLYFKTLRYDIPKDRSHAVLSVGRALYNAITKDDRGRLIETVFIEGHTDSRPARTLEMGNWGLSSYRAITVWNYWRGNNEYGAAMGGLKNRDNNPMFSISGYSATRPKIKNDNTAEKQRQNRRIDIRITMRQPNLIDLKNIKKILGENDA